MDLGSRFGVDLCAGVDLEGPAWDDDARIWAVGTGSLARRVMVVGFIAVCLVQLPRAIDAATTL
jgi:hypothetical protein